MENESFLGTIVAVVMAAVILSAVLVPIVDAESSYYVAVDENNDNPLTDMMFTYTEKPVSKTYSLAYNDYRKDITISGDYNGVVSSEINQILIGTDNWSIVVEENTVWETKDGYSKVIMGKNMGSSYTVTISNGIVEGQSEPYQYLYYPDEFGVYANYSSYRYDTEDAYSVGSFAGISVITKGGEIQNETVFDMTADVLYDDGTNEYTGVEFYPAPEPESEEESVEEDVEVHAAYDGSSGAAAASVGSPNPVAVASFQGMVHNAQVNPSNATLVGDLWYDVRSGNAIVVGVRDASLTQIVIPSSVTVDGTSYTVVAVTTDVGRQGPFQNMTSLISLTIPDTLTHFGGIDSRTGMERSPTSIYNENICRGCTSLSTFSFGSSSDLQWIGDNAFQGCTNLNLSSLPSSVRVIGTNAFADCPNVTISSLSSEITHVKYMAFSNTGITTFSFPNTAINVGDGIFRSCANLTSVTLSNETTAIPNEMFSSCTSLVSVNIPSTVTSIGNAAFYNCSNLALGSLPTTMTNIGRQAFQGCTAVTFSLLPYGLTTINNQTFYNCPNVTFSSIPDTVTSIGNSAFYGCTNVTFSIFPSSVTSIGDSAFRDCTNVRFDELPENLTSLGNDAFARCENIIISKIPDGVTALSGSPFYGCTSIRSMDLNNVSSISGSSSFPGGAFANCTALTSVTGLYITQLGHSRTGSPSHITSSSDFLNCTSLTSVNLPNLVEIGSQAFKNSGVIDIYFPHVTGIDTSVFNNCANLRTVNLPSLTDIWGIESMEKCPSLVSVNIPQVTVLPAWTFSQDGNLVTVNAGRLSSIGNGCFYHCAELKSTIDCSDCTEIGQQAFIRCTNLEHVILGENLTTINNEAFYQCTNLKITKDMPIYATVIKQKAFANCSSIESLYLPNVETILQTSFADDPPFEYCGAKEVIAPKLREIGQTNPSYPNYGGVFVNMPNLEHLDLPSLTHMYAKGVSMSNLSNNPLRNLELPSIEHIATNGIYNTSLESLVLGDNIETIGTQAISFNPNLLTVIIPGNPVIADKGFKISGASWNVVKVVILGNPTFQGDIVRDTNTVLFEILNYGDVPIYAGSHGLPANKTVIKEKLEDVAMLQIKDHIGYYKHYKDDIEYKLLLIVPLFVGLGIVMALFSPEIRSRFT